MKILTFPLGQLQANCYFLINNNDCLIIDPADEASFILEEIQRRNLRLVGMLATHGHFDHVMAAGEIQLSFNIPLYIFKEDQFLLDRLIDTAKHFLGYQPAIVEPKNIKHLKEGQLKIENFKFQIVSTPGHTPGSCCVYFEKEKTMFTGDTLFKQGVGRTDLSYSSREDLKNSLEKIFQLPKEVIIYPGHGDSAIIGQEAPFSHF